MFTVGFITLMTTQLSPCNTQTNYMAPCTSKKILFYKTPLAHRCARMGGFPILKENESVYGCWFHFLDELRASLIAWAMSWSIHCWLGPMFSPLRAEGSYFSSFSRVAPSDPALN